MSKLIYYSILNITLLNILNNLILIVLFLNPALLNIWHIFISQRGISVDIKIKDKKLQLNKNKSFWHLYFLKIYSYFKSFFRKTKQTII